MRVQIEGEAATLRPAREETFDFRIHGAMITRPGAFSLMLAVHDGDRFSRHEDTTVQS